MINGIPVCNTVANVAIKNGKVVSYGANFVKPTSVDPPQPILSSTDVISKIVSQIGGKYNNWPIKEEYCITDSDKHLVPCKAVHVYTLQIQNDLDGAWHLISADTKNGNIINTVDFVSDASYRVVPFNVQDPDRGYSVQIDPADIAASPKGWHTTGTTETSGNNVVSFKGTVTLIVPIVISSKKTKQSSATNNYDYPYNKNASPETSPNLDAARVNTFFVGNKIHDLTYLFGFTEEAYNFQNDNYGKGGAGGDRVQISVQDFTGTNNANFATPGDGQSGVMRMFTWTYTTPNRDGALENDIVCLQTTEAGGMGEGWSDALADITEINSATCADFTLGSFVTNRTGGIRTYPYSTNKTTNPLMYSSLATREEVHAIGECWAVIYHEIICALLQKYGYTQDGFDTQGTGGNIVIMHLFIDAMKLQPCNPTFLTARDAIIQADDNRYGGANKCLLWQAFAKRGLGTGATTEKVDNTQVPPGC
ncbi:extracellular metalloproteinase MEP [Ceratobasidium sp. AG-Ba]|nr:extracellular metalloproteinase MEP [Ceratobasidium sp. AG-Ba]